MKRFHCTLGVFVAEGIPSKFLSQLIWPLFGPAATIIRSWARRKLLYGG